MGKRIEEFTEKLSDRIFAFTSLKFNISKLQVRFELIPE